MWPFLEKLRASQVNRNVFYSIWRDMLSQVTDGILSKSTSFRGERVGRHQKWRWNNFVEHWLYFLDLVQNNLKNMLVFGVVCTCVCVCVYILFFFLFLLFVFSLILRFLLYNWFLLLFFSFISDCYLLSWISWRSYESFVVDSWEYWIMMWFYEDSGDESINFTANFDATSPVLIFIS